MADPIAEIKDKLSIVGLVERAGFAVIGNGTKRRTREHPSLTLYVEENTWWWFSQNAGGDIFDWYEREHRCDFRRALEDLAHLAGVELKPRSAEDEREADDERKRARVLNLACQHYHQVLMNHPAARAAREYCFGRGWTAETLRVARLGYVMTHTPEMPLRSEDWDGPGLSAQLRELKLLDHPMARAVLSMPADTLVYPHLIGGQCVYLSGRGVGAKRHYNLPAELAGPKRLYRAEPVDAAATGITVLVEGQADAVSLAQWGYRSIALGGLKPGASLHPADGRALQGVSHVALDNDPAGLMTALDVAWALDPLRRLVVWPTNHTNGTTGKNVPIKDANDLLQAGATAEEVGALLDESEPAIVMRAAAARTRDREERKAHMVALGQAWRNLDGLTQADLGPQLAKAAGLPYSQFKQVMASTKEADGEKEETGGYETSPGEVVGEMIFEQCVTWKDNVPVTSFYVVKGPDGKVERKPTVNALGTTYVPFPAKLDLIRRRVVLFPTEPLEYGSEKTLLEEVRGFIHRWLDVDAFYEQLAAYYVLFSWLYDIFENLPYLRALGDYGTGKTRFIQAIGALCYRPMFVSGASTTSPIFRVIDLFKGTLIVDEADFAKSDAAVEIIKIVNVGYSRGGIVLRSEKDEGSDSYYPSAKDVYGPKILATRKLFEDRATESRCLTKRMTTARPRPGIPRSLNRQFWADALVLRNKLLLYRLRNWRVMDVREDLSDASIEPRLDQVTLALKTLIQDPEMREGINHFVRSYNATLISDRQMSVPAVVVQVLAETWYLAEKTLVGERRDWSMKGLAERVQAVLDELDPDEKMSPRRLGSLLSADLGLTRRAKDPETRRDTVVVEEGELLALMGRYGVDIPERPMGKP